jgi:hypothetical protein
MATAIEGGSCSRASTPRTETAQCAPVAHVQTLWPGSQMARSRSGAPLLQVLAVPVRVMASAVKVWPLRRGRKEEQRCRRGESGQAPELWEPGAA